MRTEEVLLQYLEKKLNCKDHKIKHHPQSTGAMESIDTICDNLVKAFSDQKDDPISLVTIIDMYIEQVEANGTRKEKETFLEVLLEQLRKHQEIVGEIGWDLPKGLLTFFSTKSVNLHTRLTDERVVVLVMGCFNEIAVSGNPKECLLIGCQLLSELSLKNIAQGIDGNVEHEQDENLTPTQTASDVPTDTEVQYDLDVVSSNLKVQREPVVFFFGLQSHVLFELVQTVLRRISTLYPSKFLGMVISAILKYAKANIDELEDVNVILRRIYTLCRVYSPPDIPKDVKEKANLTEKELEKINEDEQALQRKLLCSLLTFGIGFGLKKANLRLDVKYYCSLSGIPFERPPYYAEATQLAIRYYQLALSFDIDLKKSFLEYIEETRNIYKSLPPDASVINQEAKTAIGQVIYQLSYTYQLQKLAKCKDLEMDQNGILVLSGLHYEATGKHLLQEINIEDAIRLYLRCTTPRLFSEVYSNLASESVALYCLWVAITNSPYKEIKQQLSELPSYMNTVFLQMFLLRNIHQTNEESRMVNFTLLTRLLCFMPESVSFSFIVDTLLTCPYAHGRLAVLSILKDLMLKTCQCKETISDQMKEMNLGEKKPEKTETKSHSSPPPTPPRPYILVNEHRMASIHSAAMLAIDACEEEAEKDDLILLLSYINFFIALKSKWNTNLLKIIYNKIDSAFAGRDDEVKEVAFIKLSNETLGEDL